MTPTAERRAGSAVGNVLVFLALAALAAALVYPRIRSSRFQERVRAVADDVEQVRARALALLQEGGTWPAAAEPGTVPAELAAQLPAGFTFRRDDHTLEWNRWATVEHPEAAPPPDDGPLADDEVEADTAISPPPSFGTLASLSVHSSDERLLAELLARYGPGRSFVRDTVWTLVFPRRAPPD